MAAGTPFKCNGKNVEKELSLGGFDVGYLAQVAMGDVPGVSPVDKFGEIPSVTTSTYPADITEIGGLYNWQPKGEAALIDTASSSDVLDVGQLCEIWGIVDPENDDGNTIGYFETNGQNKVNFYDNQELTGDPIKFWRTDRIGNMADESATEPDDFTGDIYAYIDTAIVAGVPTDLTKVRAKVTNGNNQTLMAVYTTRPKKVSFLYKGEIGMSRNVQAAEARAAYYSRRYGKIFRVKKRVNLSNSGTSLYQDQRLIPDIIPALTDIRLTLEQVSATIGAWGTLLMLEYNESLFSDAYLAAIGQPGY